MQAQSTDLRSEDDTDGRPRSSDLRTEDDTDGRITGSSISTKCKVIYNNTLPITLTPLRKDVNTTIYRIPSQILLPFIIHFHY